VTLPQTHFPTIDFHPLLVAYNPEEEVDKIRRPSEERQLRTSNEWETGRGTEGGGPEIEGEVDCEGAEEEEVEET